MLPSRNLKIYRIIVLMMVLFLILEACDDTICPNLNSSNVIIAFFDSQTQGAKSLIVDSISAIGTDSLFYKQDTASIFTLPVNTFSDSTIFLFFNKGKTDTISVHYTRTVSLLSKDCGFTQVFDQLSVSYTTFPEAVVKSRILSITNENDIEIYY